MCDGVGGYVGSKNDQDQTQDHSHQDLDLIEFLKILPDLHWSWVTAVTHGVGLNEKAKTCPAT